MEIKWSDLALRQLDDILDYVEEHFGSQTAIKTLEKVNSKVNRLINLQRLSPQWLSDSWNIIVFDFLPYDYVRCYEDAKDAEIPQHVA